LNYYILSFATFAHWVGVVKPIIVSLGLSGAQRFSEHCIVQSSSRNPLLVYRSWKMSFRKTIMIILAMLALTSSVSAAPKAPRLVLQITVDQLRGDLPFRYYDRLPEGGFKYLIKNGTVYMDAHHAHANTETIVGHATLATGAHPSVHGMVGNLWLDREKGRIVYNIEDDRYELLSKDAGVDKGTEIDPTQKAAGTQGRSPSSLMVSTFSDELSNHTAGKSKVFGVSVKDRGAVSMAGHSGKAFWFSKANGEFVTSSYYYKKYPDWVNRWNAKKVASSYSGKEWTLLNDPSTYLFKDADDQEWETDVYGFGRTFPHKFGKKGNKLLTTFLTLSPAGDEILLDFSKTLIEKEALGRDNTADYLSISFSSTDYVGHVFGPSSLESEDNLIHLDRTLADLFSYVDKTVGLDHTLIVLSSDHGSPEAPGYLHQNGIPAGYVNPKNWDKNKAIKKIKKKFGIAEELIEKYEHPYVYLNQKVIKERKLDRVQIENAIAEELVKFKGVAMAVSSIALVSASLPDTDLYRMILNNFNPMRSGDIYIVFEPHWFINDFDGLTVTATHGSPWKYDTFVPIMFAGSKIPAKHIYRRVHTVDVAPTLSRYVGAKPPSGSAGSVLKEIFGQ
jgi:predicted AlkP superfamily pyrophosphatase or phosphodiesterase